MPSKAFIQARNHGKVAQQLIAVKLRNKGFIVTLTPDGYFPGWDAIVQKPGMTFRAEIKYDKSARNTGNVAIEPGSLEKSKASMLFYVVDEPGKVSCFMMLLQDALSFAQNWPIKRRGGEFGVDLALVPYETFKSQPFIKELN